MNGKTKNKQVRNNKLLAIDNASKLIGWAFYFNGDLHEYGVLNLSKCGKRADDRMLDYHKGIKALINLYKPNEVVIETPGGGGTGWSLRVLSEFLAVVKLTCLMKKIPFHLISPREAKKLATGKGNASKVQVQQWAHDTFTDIVHPDVTEDEADAIAIGYAHIVKTKMST